MKKILNIIFTSLLIISCNKGNTQNIVGNLNNKNTTLQSACPTDSAKTYLFKHKDFNFYTEKELRGSGIVSLDIENKLEILNTDKTIFGTIITNNNGDDTFDVMFPTKKIILRDIFTLPEAGIYIFDAEKPNESSEFIEIYVNKEKKLIKKSKTKYVFETWDYVKKRLEELK